MLAIDLEDFLFGFLSLWIRSDAAHIFIQERVSNEADVLKSMRPVTVKTVQITDVI